jgi:hypothetical protein
MGSREKRIELLGVDARVFGGCLLLLVVINRIRYQVKMAS